MVTKTLADYLAAARRLLHDANAVYWPDTTLTAFINDAMAQRDRDTGMNRLLVTYPLTQGQEQYVITTINTAAYDVAGLTVVYGNTRYRLQERPYSELSMVYRFMVGYQQTPVAFSKYGANAVVVAPTPNMTYTTEWDLMVQSPPLVAPTDPDPLIFPWTDPVPFLAAHFAKLQLQQYDEAERFRQLYEARCAQVIATARQRMTANPYLGRMPIN